MTDQTSVISCRGGLNEEASDIDISAGEVRRSSNYEQVAEGGYRRIGGSAKWGGGENIPDPLRIAVIETEVAHDSRIGVSKSYETTRDEQEAMGSGVVFVPLIVMGRRLDSGTFTNILVVEKNEATAYFEIGDVVEGDTGTGEVLALNPELTVSEAKTIRAALSEFGQNIAAKASGTGRIEVLQGISERMICGRRDGEDVLMQISSPLRRLGNWGDAYRIPLGTTDLVQWDSCVYEFQGENSPTAYLVNGRSNLIIIRQDPVAVSTLAIADIDLKPTNVIVFQNHLFVGFANGSVVHSDIGEPASFTGVGGAAEFRTGSPVTGFQVLPGNSLAIFGTDRINILTGTSSLDWVMQEHSDDVGALRGSVQSLPVPIFAAIRGISTLSASDRYGDFASKTLSQQFNQSYQQIIRGSKLYSAVNRDSSQYRLINEQGHGIYMTFSSENLVGAMVVDLKSKVSAMGTIDELTNGCFYGTEDGWVYRLDQGDTFSGTDIDAFLEFPYAHQNTPRQKKAYKQTVLDMRGDPSVELQVTSTNDKGRYFHHEAEPTDVIVIEGESQPYKASTLSRFDQYFQAIAYTVGTGTDQSLLIRPDNTAPHEIDSIATHYTFRGQR